MIEVKLIKDKITPDKWYYDVGKDNFFVEDDIVIINGKEYYHYFDGINSIRYISTEDVEVIYNDLSEYLEDLSDKIEKKKIKINKKTNKKQKITPKSLDNRIRRLEIIIEELHDKNIIYGGYIKW